jgi:oligoribonuclease NrnB/cAMP/cGMP phosphodiesterase (DHH superfamily)
MRLITRADLDGLTCALLLSEAVKIDEVTFAHPKDVQDGKVEIGPNDVLANLPRDPRAGLVFDHHVSQAGEWSSGQPGGNGAYTADAPSAARVIANHYAKHDFSKYEELLHQTDRLDSAHLEPDDVTDPKGWILLGYTLDPRTGMARYRDYFLHVLELVKAHPQSPDAVLADAQVQERVKILQDQQWAFMEHLIDQSKLDGNVIVTDVRGKKDVALGNRFYIYTLFPDANVSVRIADGAPGSNTCSIQVGHSIFNRTCTTNVGELLAKYGGGGHAGAGTAQPAVADADRVLNEVVTQLKAAG